MAATIDRVFKYGETGTREGENGAGGGPIAAPTVHEDGQQAVEERLQPLVAGRDDLVEHRDQEVRVRPGEDGNVHRNGGRVRFVEPHAEVPFARQQQQNEYADVHQSDASYSTIERRSEQRLIAETE